MLKTYLFDEEGLNHRLEILRQLAKSIAVEIDEIVGTKEDTSSSEESRGFEISLDEQIRRFEMDLIRFALFKSGGKQIHAARMLKIKPSTLNSRIKRYRISSDSFRYKTPDGDSA